MYYLTVDRDRIQRNREQGRNAPPLRVHTPEGLCYPAYAVHINGPSRLVYSRDQALPGDGAHAWLETTGPLLVDLGVAHITLEGEPEWYTITEAAAHLGLHDSTVRRLVYRGAFAQVLATPLGYLIPKSELERVRAPKPRKKRRAPSAPEEAAA